MARQRLTVRKRESRELRAVYAELGGVDAFRAETVKSRVRRFIGCYVDTHGFGPHCDEVAEAVGITFKTARAHVYELAADGVITFTPHRWRSIRLVSKGE